MGCRTMYRETLDKSLQINASEQGCVLQILGVGQFN